MTPIETKVVVSAFDSVAKTLYRHRKYIKMLGLAFLASTGLHFITQQEVKELNMRIEDLERRLNHDSEDKESCEDCD